MDPLLASAILQNKPSLVSRLIARSPGKAFSRSIDGLTPLMAAAKLGRREIVAALIPSSSPAALDPHGDSALSLAAAGMSPSCFEALLPHSDLGALSRSGRSPLMMAAEIGSLRGIQWILAARGRSLACMPDERGSTALMRSAEFGHLDCLQELAPCSRLFALNAAGQSALSLAAIAGHVPCVKFILALAARSSFPEGAAQGIAERLIWAARTQSSSASLIASLSLSLGELIELGSSAAGSPRHPSAWL